MKYNSLRVLAGILIFISANCFAGGLAELDIFLKEKDQGHLTFVQTTVRKIFDGTPRTVMSRGSMEFVRPDKYRIDYPSPSNVLIVADGEKVSIYDAILSLTTVNKQSGLIPPSALLLLNSRGANELSSAYRLRETSDKEVDWAILTPIDFRNEAYTKISLGFEKGELSRVEIETSNGDRLIYQLSWQGQASVDLSRFRFTAPAGSDIVNNYEKFK